MNFFYSLLLVLVLSEILAVCGFNGDRTRYIDSTFGSSTVHTNYLFRGEEPLNSTGFAYDAVVASIVKAGKEAGVTIPEKFYLIDFNLLTIHLGDIAWEKDFFKKYPKLGYFIQWSIIGNEFLNPDDFPADIRKKMAIDLRDWQYDDLPKTMTTLRNLLYTNHSLPTVIFVHCEAGKDRTGEVSGSWYIRYLKWSFQRALYYDDKCVEGSRNIREASKNAFQWYCYYLLYTNPEFGNLDCSDKIVGNSTDCKWIP